MLQKLLSVGGFTLLSRITGFARDMLLAWILGAGILSDAFFVAFVFPNNFRAIFGEGTLNPAFLPRYAALHAKGEKAAAAKFADDVFAWQMAAQLVLLVLAMIFMPQLDRAAGAGLCRQSGAIRPDGQPGAITFPYLILTLVAVQLSAMLNAIEKFWAAAAWSNLLNLAMIATLIAWHWFPNAAYAAAWGVLLGGVAQLIFIVWAGRAKACGCACPAALDAAGGGILPRLRRGDHRRTPVVIAGALDRQRACQLPADRQPDGALLCRPHQPVAAGRAGHRAGHGPAAGNVGAAGTRRRRRLACGAEPRGGDEPAADLALRGRLPCHSRHPDARGVRAWRLRRQRRHHGGAGAGGLWHRLAGHGAGAHRGADLLCPPRHRHAGARHLDRHGLQYRAEGLFRLGAATGRGGDRAGHGAGRLDQYRAPDLVWAQPRPAGDRAAVLPRPAGFAAGGAGGGRRRLDGRIAAAGPGRYRGAGGGHRLRRAGLWRGAAGVARRCRWGARCHEAVCGFADPRRGARA